MTKADGILYQLNILGKETSSPLAYDMGLEPHPSTMVIMSGQGGRLEISIYIYICHIYIETTPIIGLCLAAERHPGSRVEQRW